MVGKIYSVIEAAEQLGVVPATVRRWIRKKELEAVLIGGSKGYVVTEEALRAFLESRETLRATG